LIIFGNQDQAGFQNCHSAGDVGQYSDIAVDSDGYIHISYYDVTNTALKYATTTSPVACTYNIDPTSKTLARQAEQAALMLRLTQAVPGQQPAIILTG